MGGDTEIGDATEDITVLSLPNRFMRTLRRFVLLQKDVSLKSASTLHFTSELSQVSILTRMEKEAKPDDI